MFKYSKFLTKIKKLYKLQSEEVLQEIIPTREANNKRVDALERGRSRFTIFALADCHIVILNIFMICVLVMTQFVDTFMHI